MLSRNCKWFVVAVLLAVPAAAAAGAKSPPTVVVRTQSLEAIVDNAKMLAALAGREEAARQMEALVKTKIGQNGLEGIDMKRPIGAYARLGKDVSDIAGALLVPIADEKSFLALLENLNVSASKDGADIYSLNVGLPVSVYFRFAHKYVYVTGLNIKALADENLALPADIFGAYPLPTLSAAVRLDQIPEQARLLASIQLESALDKLRDQRKPNETALQQTLRVKAAEEAARKLKLLIDEGAELTANLNINAATKQVDVDVDLKARPGSELAGDISKMAQTPSLFAGLADKQAAMAGALRLLIPDALQPAARAVIDEAMEKGLDRIGDARKRKLAQSLIDALGPTLKAGEIDVGVSLIGPSADRNYGMIAAVKLRDGDKLAKTLRSVVDEIAAEVPAEERDRLKLDFADVTGTKIHRMDIQDKFDDKGREIFGAHPVYVALRNDAAFLALGDGGFAALRKAIADQGGKDAAVLVEMSMARLGPLSAKSPAQRAVIRRVLDSNDDPRISLSVTGGASLRIRAHADLSLVPLFTQLKALEDE